MPNAQTNATSHSVNVSVCNPNVDAIPGTKVGINIRINPIKNE